MKQIDLDERARNQIVSALERISFFEGLKETELDWIANQAHAYRYETDEYLLEYGEASDSFLLLMQGRVSVRVPRESEHVEIAQLDAVDTLGEVGLLLNESRTADVVALDSVMALHFEPRAFEAMYRNLPQFGLGISRALADRLHQTSHQLPIAETTSSASLDEGTLNQHSSLSSAASETLGEESLVASDVRATDSDDLAQRSPTFHELLRKMVLEGASDLHLSAGQQPHWRIDGIMRRVKGADTLGSEEVVEMLGPLLGDSEREEFRRTHDVDFGMTVEGIGRFRVNLFLDHHGVGAVFRLIPGEIRKLHNLGLPSVTEDFCEQPKGLVLVTGPTGSGKSTTLAAMIDHINQQRREHIITIEDPIEYVHESERSLINQRDVGVHTEDFASALRAALREDPDIVLVGELRDLETIRIALETANTGHLVFGSLHTSTAASTIDRILGLFPSDEEEQVRSTLADTLRGVISQVLCRKKGGGQTVAYEVLVSDHAVSNLIRENKTHQIPNAMQTHQDAGNVLLNATLADFVRQNKITYREALGKTTDRDDLAKRLDKPVDNY